MVLSDYQQEAGNGDTFAAGLDNSWYNCPKSGVTQGSLNFSAAS